MIAIIAIIFAFSFIQQNEQPKPAKFNPSPTARPTDRPVPTATPTTSPIPTAIPTEAPQAQFQGAEYSGLASYYSRAGCVGCHPAFIMANGRPLDDGQLTVAFNRAPLGTMVKITNVKTGSAVVAEVTDTGGFEKLAVPKIIDLSVATKNAIGCSDICQVTIEL